MALDQLAHLLLREPHRVFKKRAVRFQDKLDHAFWILAARAIFNMYLVLPSQCMAATKITVNNNGSIRIEGDFSDS